MTPDFPSLKGYDHTLPLLREGYGFISRRCDMLGTDIFRTRLMLSPVFCARGARAAEMFYGGDRFTRRGALPPTVLRLLQDKGSVQQLDGTAHRRRKALFLDLLTTDEAERQLLETFRAEWRAALLLWARKPSIRLLPEMNVVLTRTICRWMDLPLHEKSDLEFAHELASMIDNSGRVGPSSLKALLLRRRTETFVRRIVADVRERNDRDSHGTPISRLAAFRNADGQLLDLATATVEAINILRPTVAVGRFIVFATMALHRDPELRASLQGADDIMYEKFAEEVRRFYPFFPFVGGIARADFDWHGWQFHKGDWMLLDLYGTDHDHQRFSHPERFDPARDISWLRQDFDFVPQGGGEAARGHRCPGERFSVALTREAARLLVEETAYDVPDQDLSLPLDRLPTGPRNGLALANVRAAGAG